MLEKVRKIFSILVILVYLFVVLVGYFPTSFFVDKTYAEDVLQKDNLVLILVDSNLISSLKNDIRWYAGYVQNRNKNTKSIVLPVDTKALSSYDIFTIIKNLYFGGEKNHISFLKTIVLIGNIPLPVVNKDGYIFTSIYPYVDLVKPAFKWN
jgi:hypothetical protein